MFHHPGFVSRVALNDAEERRHEAELNSRLNRAFGRNRPSRPPRAAERIIGLVGALSLSLLVLSL